MKEENVKMGTDRMRLSLIINHRHRVGSGGYEVTSLLQFRYFVRIDHRLMNVAVGSLLTDKIRP